MKRWLTYLFCCFLSGSITAQVAVDAAVDRDSILIGEQIGLSLRIDGPANMLRNVKWPALRDSITPNLEVVASDSMPDSLLTDNDLQLQYNLLITSFDSGTFVLPGMPIRYMDTVLYTPPIQIYSTTVPVDTTQAIMDIKDIYEVESTWGEWLADNWMVLTGVGVILILGILLFIIAKKRNNPAAYKPELKKRELLYHEQALHDLEALNKKQLWQKGKYKMYYSEMTDILRYYVENRYRVNAFEQTTRQLSENLRYTNMEENARMSLKHILTIADLVKFAKEKPSDSENKRNLEDAVRFIDQTRPLHTSSNTETASNRE